MPVTIGSNLVSLGVARQVDASTDALSRVFERLSSGARINRASDDAAGLSVSLGLNAKSRVLTRAAQNLSDGSSLLQIADGALDQIGQLLTRMVELSEQSANGSYASVQRRALNTEYEQLNYEIRRIASSTSFNRLELLTGSRSSRAAETEYTAASSLNLVTSLSANGRYAVFSDNSSGSDVLYRKDLETGEVIELELDADLLPQLTSAGFQVLDSGDVYFSAFSLNRFTNDVYRWNSSDQTVDRVTNSQGFVEPNFGFRVSADGSTLVFSSQTTNYIDGQGTSSAFSAVDGEDTYLLELSTGVIRDLGTALDGYSNFVLSANGQYIAAGGVLARRVGDSFEYLTSPSGALIGISNSGEAFLSSNANHTGNNPNGFNQFYKFNLNSEIVTQVSNFQVNSGLAGAALSPDGTTLYFRTNRDLTGDNAQGVQQVFRFDLAISELRQMTDYRENVFAVGFTSVIAANGSRILGLSGAELSSVDLSAEESSFDFEAGFGERGNIIATFDALESAIRGLRSNSILDVTSARTALDDLTASLQGVTRIRGKIGASLSRMQSAVSLTIVQQGETKAAESRLKDADIASESAALVRLRILQQVGASLLAQANQQPRLAVTLLS